MTHSTGTYHVLTPDGRRGYYRRKWSKISVKAKNRLKRLKRRIKAWEAAVKDRPAAEGAYFERSTKRPGSLKR